MTKEWYYHRICVGEDSMDVRRDLLWEMLDDPDNDLVQEEFAEWFDEFEDNHPDTTMFAFVTEHADGVCTVSDMLTELKRMFVECVADRDDVLEYCGARLCTVEDD